MVVWTAGKTRKGTGIWRRKRREDEQGREAEGRLLRFLGKVAAVGAGWESRADGVHDSCLLLRRALWCVGAGAGCVLPRGRAAHLNLLGC